MSSPKMIVLKSSDGETFEVEEAVALEWQTIKLIFDKDCAGTTIPLPNVTSEILAMVIEYTKHHVAASASAEDLRTFDAQFVEVRQAKLFDLIQAANYLNIKSLLDLTCQKVADIIKDQTTEEMREMFNIENDYTPEEEAEVRRRYAWAFER